MEAPAGTVGTIMPGNIAKRKPIEQLQAEVRTPLWPRPLCLSLEREPLLS